MEAATLKLILTLLPLAEKLVFAIGDKIVELNTTEIKSKEDLIAMLEELKDEEFPEYSFTSTQDETSGD